MVGTAQRVMNGVGTWKESPKWLVSFATHGLPQLAVLVLVILIAQQAAVLTWRFIPEPAEKDILTESQVRGESSPQAKQTAVMHADRIAALHLFGRAGVVEAAPQKTAVTKAPDTRLNLTLHGVFAEDDDKAGAAIIGKAGSKQDYYKVGNQVMNGVKLQAVYNDRVALLRNGASEVLRFPKTVKTVDVPSEQGSVAAPTSSDSLKKYADQFKNQPLKIFDHVRFVPVRSGSEVKGYRVLPQRNRELYNKLGIRPSDLVTAVNGVALSDNKEAMKLMDKLKDMDQIDLQLIRKGQTQTLTLSLK